MNQKNKFGEFEIIIVDCMSTDNTVDICKRYAGIRVLSCPQRNVSMARNLGLDLAKSAYIIFLDSDVELPACWLQDCYVSLANSPFSITQGPIEPTGDRQLDVFRKQYSFLFTTGTFNHIDAFMLPLVVTNTAACMMKSSIIADHRFDVSFKKTEDIDFVSRLALNGGHFICTETEAVKVSSNLNFCQYLLRSIRSGFYGELFDKKWGTVSRNRAEIRKQFKFQGLCYQFYFELVLLCSRLGMLLQKLFGDSIAQNNYTYLSRDRLKVTCGSDNYLVSGTVRFFKGTRKYIAYDYRTKRQVFLDKLEGKEDTFIVSQDDIEALKSTAMIFS